MLLTFGNTLYVKDRRISIHRSKGKDSDDWRLEILHSKQSDQGVYECQISTEPPQFHKIYLSVEGLYYILF